MRTKRLLCAALLPLALALMAGANRAWEAHEVRWRPQKVSCELESGVSFEVMSALRRQIAMDGRGDASGWAQVLSVTAESEDTGASVEVDAVYVDGDAALIMDARMVSGELPGLSDDIGCAVDEETALALLGSTDVAGQWITVNGGEMIIRGVMESIGGRGLAICPAKLAGEERQMAGLALMLWPGRGREASEWADELLSLSGISSAAMNDHATERALGAWVLRMVTVATQIAVLAMILHAVWCLLRRRIPDSMRWVSGTALFALGAGIGIALLFDSPPPMALLPTRWSDFAFWPQLFAQWSEAGSELLLQGVSRVRMMELSSMARVVGLSAASVALSVCAVFAMKGWIDEVVGVG